MYNERLAARIRERVAQIPGMEEKIRLDSLFFSIKDKNCMCIMEDQLLCVIDPALHDEAVSMGGIPDSFGRKGVLKVDRKGTRKDDDLDYWVNLSMDYCRQNLGV
jgi:hypothetical protein